MENLPLPQTKDHILITCLILLNREIEALKKQLDELKKTATQ